MKQQLLCDEFEAVEKKEKTNFHRHTRLDETTTDPAPKSRASSSSSMRVTRFNVFQLEQENEERKRNTRELL